MHKERNMGKEYGLYLSGLLSFDEYCDISESVEKIKPSDKVRNKIGSIKSYWLKPGEALTHIQGLLHEHNYIVDNPSFDISDSKEDGQQNFSLSRFADEKAYQDGVFVHVDNVLVFNWHWMPSGNQVEIVSYIS